MKNKINLYNCKDCGNTIVTEDVDEGVTPFMLFCHEFEGCRNGMMISMGYNVPSVLVASHEWYAPKGMSEVPDNEKEHVYNGGLLIRKKK